MGQPKLLLPWGSSNIIGHLTALWQTLGADQIAVVCAPPPHPLLGELDQLPFVSRIINATPQQGMFSSIQAAARWSGWKSDITHFALALGDQPQIPLPTLKAIVDFAEHHPASICQPSFQNRPKHPAVFPRSIFRELGETASPTLRDFLADHASARLFLEIADPNLQLDLDTPADYEAAFRASTSSEHG